MTRRLFGSLLGLVFLVNFGRTAFAPLLPELQTAFGVGPAAVGVVASLVWIGTGVVRFPVGYLLTRTPRQRVVVAAGLVLAVAAGFTATAPTVGILQFGSLLVGLASGAYFAAAVPLISDLFPERVGRAVGIHGTAAQLAAVVAPTAVVVVLGVASWRAVFWGLAAACLLVTGALVVATRNESAPSESMDRSFRAALGNWRVMGTGILMIATAGFVWQGLFNFYVGYLTTARSLDATTASTLLTLTFAAGVPAFWISGRLADRLPHLPYIVGLLCAFTLCVFAFTVARGFGSLLAVSVLLGYAIHSLFPALDAYVLGALPAGTRGSTYAVFSGLSLLVEATGSGVVGVLLEAGYAFDAVFRVFAAGMVVVVAALVALSLAGRLPNAAGGGHTDASGD
ncbi:MFS transporter [Salinigranum rubrum]|uniref:MFS transporter n=1 Tax=Salinigranum rubrum TaxID=755307 RepID=A0A2I8VIH2_9EURY|nr:MFS transporter [Salinigranum rubrum]AUV81732.1 MFS transporter [Salinigranum rubrum]